MSFKISQSPANLAAEDISAVIQMAWEDRTSFETIQERTGLSESAVIRIAVVLAKYTRGRQVQGCPRRGRLD